MAGDAPPRVAKPGPELARPERLGLFGIRHHGPGSARSLLAALAALDPAIVLIEGPAEATPLIAYAAAPGMVPPLAILVHGQDDPSLASFYPFAVYSPEWQALRWAQARGRPARFIDLPAEHDLAQAQAARGAAAAAGEAPASEETGDDEAGEAEGGAAAAAPADDPIRRDPLGYLAALAGYGDGEAWWNALIEQGAGDPAIFAAIETAMTELRARADLETWQSAEARQREDRREAHMRLAIAAALKETAGPVAVVCGAWHVPALRRKAAAADRTLLKGLPRLKVAATWVPWTETRLAAASGYGAGVVSPGWYAHVWGDAARAADGAFSPRRFTARWQVRVAALLRRHGRPAPTASVIEAARLAEALASLRDLAVPGLEEMRAASLATLCQGEPAPMALIESELVIGRAVGAIDEGVPQMPLAADLARWQKKLKLKPEALDRELAVDLRSETGLARSLLLHRLALLGVHWGRLEGAGASRGTFRENWVLRWEPEFSVALAEALVHGTTIVQAAGNAAIAAAQKAPSLTAAADIVRACLLAGLDDAARAAIALLQARAVASADIAALAGAVPPLAAVLRYGTARVLPEEELRLLVVSLAEAVCAGLVHACRRVQADEAEALRNGFAAFDQALALLDRAASTEAWRRALAALADDGAGDSLLRGFAVRALYDAGAVALEAAAAHLSRALSPAVAPLDAGRWLEGFLGRAGAVLLHDAALLAAIDRWLAALDAAAFMESLPMLRRAFGAIDRAERRRLLDAARAAGAGAAMPAMVVAGEAESGFAAALPLLLTILGLDRETRP